jgi:tetratricopeptide (TPR) repeat protein
MRARVTACCAALLLASAGPAAAQAVSPPSGIDAVRDLLARGQASEALARIDAAPAAAADAPGAVSTTPELRFLRGVALMDLGRDAEALAWFEAMTQDYPELPDPWNNIALLHVRAGRLDGARRALEAALRNDPGYRLARSNLGLVHLMLAVQAWEEVVKSGPVDATLTRRLQGARALLAQPVAPAATQGAPSPAARTQ